MYVVINHENLSVKKNKINKLNTAFFLNWDLPSGGGVFFQISSISIRRTCAGYLYHVANYSYNCFAILGRIPCSPAVLDLQSAPLTITRREHLQGVSYRDGG